MTSEALFGLSVLMSFLAFGIVTKLYIWPRLRVMPRRDSLMALVVPHTFRFVGLSFLVPGVVSATLPSAFAVPAAYGDLVAAVLAAIATWRSTRARPRPSHWCGCSTCGGFSTSSMQSTTARSGLELAPARSELHSIFQP